MAGWVASSVHIRKQDEARIEDEAPITIAKIFKHGPLASPPECRWGILAQSVVDKDRANSNRQWPVPTATFWTGTSKSVRW